MSFFIISHSHMVRDILRSTCSLRDIEVTETYENSSELKDVHEGDVVVLHTGRAIDNAIDQVAHLRDLCPDLRIVMITSDAVTTQIRDLLSDKVEAIMPENNSDGALIGTLAVVSEGYKVVHPSFNQKPQATDNPRRLGLRKARTNGTTKPIGTPSVGTKASRPLSPRESAVLEKLRGGGSNKDIANDLGICEATVKVHLRTCFQKIGVKNRTQAAVWAAERL